MHISVQFPADEAITDDELRRIHQDGPYSDSFFNSYFFDTRPERKDGVLDFSEAWISALKELFNLEPRIAQGRHYSISFS